MYNRYLLEQTISRAKIGHCCNLSDRISSKDISKIEEHARGDAEIYFSCRRIVVAYDTLRTDEELWRATAAFGSRMMKKRILLKKQFEVEWT